LFWLCFSQLKRIVNYGWSESAKMILRASMVQEYARERVPIFPPHATTGFPSNIQIVDRSEWYQTFWKNTFLKVLFEPFLKITAFISLMEDSKQTWKTAHFTINPLLWSNKTIYCWKGGATAPPPPCPSLDPPMCMSPIVSRLYAVYPSTEFLIGWKLTLVKYDIDQSREVLTNWLFTQIENYVENDTSQAPLLLVGNAGSGKSAIMARIASNTLTKGANNKLRCPK
jgi:hypothetical protein